MLESACGLSSHEFDVLLTVQHAADGGLRLVALGKMIRLSQPSLSRAVARLLPDRLTPDEQELLARALTRVAEGAPASRKETPWHSQPRSA